MLAFKHHCLSYRGLFNLLHCSQCSILCHQESLQDVKLEKDILCFLLYCDIHLDSSLMEEEIHEAANYLVRSHQKASNKCFLHGTFFLLLPLISCLISLASYYSSFKFQSKWLSSREPSSLPRFYLTLVAILASMPLVSVPALTSHSLHWSLLIWHASSWPNNKLHKGWTSWINHCGTQNINLSDWHIIIVQKKKVFNGLRPLFLLLRPLHKKITYSQHNS